jgi:hypothetical protein
MAEPSLTELDDEFEAAEQAAAVRNEALRDRLARQQANDRSAIAKIIVWAFVVLMVDGGRCDSWGDFF